MVTDPGWNVNTCLRIDREDVTIAGDTEGFTKISLLADMFSFK